MPELKDFTFPSSTGKNEIRARICAPEGKPKAVVQIVHGIAEHIERYDRFMLFLAEHGYLAVGNDHLGHGKTARKKGEIGIFSLKDGWTYVVEDMKILHDRMKKEYPGVPFFFFGHSMGSFLTRTFMIRFPNQYDGAILSGTGQQPPLLIHSGLLIAELLTAANGPASSGKTLNDMAFGSYLKKIENPRTPFDWLSRVPEVVDRYIADPLCGFVCKCSVYRDMLKGLKYLTNEKNLEQMNKNAPVFFLSGAEDPVGEWSAGVERAYKSFCDAGMKDVSLRLYPGGRHEMLNEINYEEVQQDILDWLNAHLPEAKEPEAEGGN